MAVHFIAVSPSRELPVTARRDDALISVALESGVRRFGESSTVFEVATPQFNGLTGFNCWPAVRSWPKRATQVSLQQQAAQFGRDRHRCVRQPIKLQRLLDHDGSLPRFAVITDGKTHELNVARKLRWERGRLWCSIVPTSITSGLWN